MNKLGVWMAAGVVAMAAGGVWGETGQGWRSDGSGVYEQVKVPQEWSAEKNVVWKTPVESWGNAMPVVVGGKVLVGAEKGAVVCLNLADGKELWREAGGYAEAGVKPTWKVESHEVNGFSTPTPLCDGKLVVVFNGYGVGAGYDLNGKRQWIRLIGTPSGGWGNSSSGVLVDGVAVWSLNGNAYGIEAATGKELWKTKSASHWGSLVSVKVGDTAVAITPDGDFLRVADGKKLAKGSPLVYNAPVVAGGVVYFMCGENGCKAFALPEKVEGDKLELKELWSAKVGKKDRTYSSPVVFEGLVYVTTQRGDLTAFDAKSGAVVWEHAMKLGGTTYPSLVVAGTKEGARLLVSSDTGATAMVVPGREYKEAGRNKLEAFRSTPVCVKGEDGDRMILRTMKSVWCLGEK